MDDSEILNLLKPIFPLATLFARREAKTGIRQRDWLKLAGEKIRREQVGSVPTFLSVRANKVAKWKIGFTAYRIKIFLQQNFWSPTVIHRQNESKFTLTVILIFVLLVW